MRSQLVGAVRHHVPGGVFDDMGGLGQFHLDRMEALRRATIMARCPASLEPAIQDRSVARGRTANVMDCCLNFHRAGGAVVRANVEIR